MNYDKPLLEGKLLKRYKRFFGDVQLGTDKVVAHVPNTGSMKGIADATPLACRISPAKDPKRKLKFTLEQVKLPETWVGVNTHRANQLAWEAFEKQVVPHWNKYSEGRREYKLNAKTRLDLRLDGPKGSHFVEVKSVTMAEGKIAKFPDAVTTRGQKHLEELMALVSAGESAELLFIVQRTDCVEFSPADEIDPVYGKLLRKAQKIGVKISAYPVIMQNDRIALNTKKELKLIF